MDQGKSWAFKLSQMSDVCHMYSTRRRVTTDFFTSCELAKFPLSKNMTLVATLRKNKLEISALFLSRKQTDVYSSILGCTNDLTLISYVPARNKAVILSSQRHDDTCMGEEKDYKLKVIMHYNATKSGCDILDKLVREYTYTRLTSHRPLELFLSSTAAVCVNAFVLWKLKS